MFHSPYQVGGSLHRNAPSYVKRAADQQLYEVLARGEFGYVFNCRQMGKSSLLVQMLHQFKARGYRCATLDMSRVGSEDITPLQWYKGIVTELWKEFDLWGTLNLKQWWQETGNISFVQKLGQFIEGVLLDRFPNDRFIILIDEIDSTLSLPFATDDFFAFIRFCYNQRTIDSNFNRLAFTLFGVATPSDLIKDKSRTPFNIGKAIALEGFTFEQAQPLVSGLEPYLSNAALAVREILTWTGGQPFLTQKLCDLVRQTACNAPRQFLDIAPHKESVFIRHRVRSRIIKNWQAQDEPEHLRTICDRLTHNEKRASGLLGIYKTIWKGEKIASDNSREHIELILSGLVVKHHGTLQVKNRIYREVFNLEWIEQQLARLRPYSQAFEHWIASHRTDTSRLLRGRALQEALSWAQGSFISKADSQFLAISEAFDRQEVQRALEADRAREVEARLLAEQTRQWHQKRANRLQQLLLGVVGIALLVVGIASLKTLQSERQARIREIKALATASQGLFDSYQRLDALVEAIRAKRRLQQVRNADPQLSDRVEAVLRQSIHGAIEYNRLTAHNASVLGVDVSPNGRYIATSSADSTVILWQLDGTLERRFKVHEAAVFRVKFSPDSRTLLTSGVDTTAKLLRLDGTVLATFTGHQAPVWAAQFSPDGQLLATASEDGTVKLWRLDGTLVRTLNGHTSGVRSLEFSPDGSSIVSVSNDGTAKLWTLEGTLQTTFTGHDATVLGVDFSPDGQLLATASEDETVKLWRLDGTLVRTIDGHEARVWDVRFHPNGQQLASSSDDKTVKLWKLDGTEIHTLRGHKARVIGLAFDPDGQFLTSASEDNIARRWKLKQDLFTKLMGHQGSVRGVDVSLTHASNATFATAGVDRTIKLWRLDGTLLETLTGHAAAVWDVRFLPGDRLVSASGDATLKIWRSDGTLVQTLEGHRAGVYSIDLSSDGRWLVSGGWDTTAKLWHAEDGSLVRTFDRHQGIVWDVAFSSDSQWLVSGSADKTAIIWRRDGTPLHVLVGHKADIWGVEVSPDDRYIATASLDGAVKLWHADDGTLVRTFETGGAGLHGVTFSPDSRQIVAASLDGTVTIWEIDRGTKISLYGHETSVDLVRFVGDSTQLISTGTDGSILLWNLDRVLNLDELDYGCNWVRDYLTTSRQIEASDRALCEE
jgi:WD40 repeat protein